MNKVVKISLLVLIIVITAAGVVFWIVQRATNVDMEPKANNHVVDFEEVNEKVYIRAMTWGIAGNHSEVILSTAPIEPGKRKSEKAKDYIFYTQEVYYKKQGADTLLVYAESSSIGEPPLNFSSKINIVPIELNTYDETQDYEKNYRKYGLTKISVYSY